MAYQQLKEYCQTNNLECVFYYNIFNSKLKYNLKVVNHDNEMIYKLTFVSSNSNIKKIKNVLSRDILNHFENENENKKYPTDILLKNFEISKSKYKSNNYIFNQMTNDEIEIYKELFIKWIKFKNFHHYYIIFYNNKTMDAITLGSNLYLKNVEFPGDKPITNLVPTIAQIFLFKSEYTNYVLINCKTNEIIYEFEK